MLDLNAGHGVHFLQYISPLLGENVKNKVIKIGKASKYKNPIRKK